jgi:uncharacterized protein YjbI with pentapeptide repeats
MSLVRMLSGALLFGAVVQLSIGCSESGSSQISPCTGTSARSFSDIQANGGVLCDNQHLIATLDATAASKTRTGAFEVPYQISRQGPVEICFGDDDQETHLAELLDSDGAVVVSTRAGSECQTAPLFATVYTLRVTHAMPGVVDNAPDVVHTRFTAAKSPGGTSTLNVTSNSCQNCDFTGQEMPLLSAPYPRFGPSAYTYGALYGFSGDYEGSNFTAVHLPRNRPTRPACGFGLFYQTGTPPKQSFRNAKFGDPQRFSRVGDGFFDCEEGTILFGDGLPIDMQGAVFTAVLARTVLGDWLTDTLAVSKTNLTRTSVQRFGKTLRLEDSQLDQYFFEQLVRSTGTRDPNPTLVTFLGGNRVAITRPFAFGTFLPLPRAVTDVAPVLISFPQSNLQKSDLAAASLQGLKLINLNLTNSNFRGATLYDVDFTDSVLSAADFTDTKFSEAVFNRTTLSDALFTRVSSDRLVARGAGLRGAHFDTAAFKSLDFSGANFTGGKAAALQSQTSSFASCVLDDADFSGATLPSADFTKAQANGMTVFTSAMLSGADFSFFRSVGAQFSSATLTGATLVSARLYSANLEGARLAGANLSGALLCGASLAGADFTSANLAGAVIPLKDTTIRVGGADVACAATSGRNSVVTNDATTCPDGGQGPCTTAAQWLPL